MLDRAALIEVAVALVTALLVIVLVDPATGPLQSRADLGSPLIPLDELHRQLDSQQAAGPFHPRTVNGAGARPW